LLPTYQDLNRDFLSVIERYAKAQTVEEKVELLKNAREILKQAQEQVAQFQDEIDRVRKTGQEMTPLPPRGLPPAKPFPKPITTPPKPESPHGSRMSEEWHQIDCGERGHDRLSDRSNFH